MSCRSEIKWLRRLRKIDRKHDREMQREREKNAKHVEEKISEALKMQAGFNEKEKDTIREKIKEIENWKDDKKGGDRVMRLVWGLIVLLLSAAVSYFINKL